MRRRLLAAFLGLTILAVTLFAVPLGLVIARRQSEQDRTELSFVAIHNADRVPLDYADSSAAVTLHSDDRDQRIALYTPDGDKHSGSGPDRLETAGFRVDEDEVVAYTTAADLVTVAPVSDESGRLTGIVRVSELRSVGLARIGSAHLLLAGVGLVVVAIAGTIGVVVTRRLSRPLEQLSADARRIGDGDFTVEPATTGIPEIDEVGRALAGSAQRVGDLLAREQAFSADASHQLRTPLTGLRLTIENELGAPRPDHRDALNEALTDVDRLESTITGLLALARDISPGDRDRLDLAELVRSRAGDWRRALERSGRRLEVDADDAVVVRASAVAIAHVLDVLVDNATGHGVGVVTVVVDIRTDAAVVSVADEGERPNDAAAPFVRRSDQARGTGIGLSLARRLTETEGGRLTLAPAPETTFEIRLPLDPPHPGGSG